MRSGIKGILKSELKRKKRIGLRIEDYDDKKVVKMIKEYRKTKNADLRSEIISECYPIIFSILKRFGAKNDTTGAILNHDDLFSEGVLKVDKCIDLYDGKFKVKFSTYIWVSVTKTFNNFVWDNLYTPEGIFRKLDDFSQDEIDGIFFNNGKMDYILEHNEKIKMEAMEDLNDFEKRILFFKMKNYKMKEICDMFNLNTHNYYKVIKDIQNKLKV